MGRKVMLAVALVVLGVAAVGCSSAPAYQSIDLSQNLTPDALQRYESEFQSLSADEQGAHMATLEHSNWWLPGLLVYYKRATVMRMPGPDGPMYEVMYGWGIGPFSVLYSDSTHATYTSKGERLSGMGMDNFLWGHLAMIHSGDALLPNGAKETYSSMGLIHHLFNVDTMDGHTYFSLFTVPNPAGADVSH